MLLNLFSAWWQLGPLQKTLERMADLEDGIARMDAQGDALDALLGQMRDAADDPARLQALEDELLEFDPAAWHDYQLALGG